MSRTLKDRPYWVKVNKPAKNWNIIIAHDHFHFGEPIKKSVKVLDANGNQLTETRTVKGYFRPEYTIEVPVYEQVTVGHKPDECDAYEPVDGAHGLIYWRKHNCGRYLADFPKYHHATRHWKTEKHSSTRAKERAALTEYKKQHNDSGTEHSLEDDSIFDRNGSLNKYWLWRY